MGCKVIIENSMGGIIQFAVGFNNGDGNGNQGTHWSSDICNNLQSDWKSNSGSIELTDYSANIADNAICWIHLAIHMGLPNTPSPDEQNFVFREGMDQQIFYIVRGGTLTPHFIRYEAEEFCRPRPAAPQPAPDYCLTTSGADNRAAAFKGYVGAEAGYVVSNEQPGMMPLDRFFHPDGGHHCTIDANERNDLIAAGWIPQGTLGFVWPTEQPGTAPLHRFYKNETRRHFFTIKAEEHASMIAAAAASGGYTYEGPACYVYQGPVQVENLIRMWRLIIPGGFENP